MSLNNQRYIILFIPILSMCILTLGNSFYTTCTTIELYKMNQNNFTIGLISTAYYTGMVMSSSFNDKIILRLGYTRSYILFSTLIGLSAISQGLIHNIFFWSLTRFTCGYALGGIFIIIDSWCLQQSDNNKKGLFLSIYLFIYYTCQASGQLLLKVEYTNILSLFSLISILAHISIIPILFITKFQIYQINHTKLLSFIFFIKKSLLGILTALVAGMILGSIYTIYPLFLKQLGISIDKISYIMLCIILGGICFQFPIGKLSDIINRKIVILFILINFFCISILIYIFYKDFFTMLFLSFLLGGGAFTIYPLSINYSSYYLKDCSFVQIVSFLALFYSSGAMIGPIIVTSFMSIFGIFGFCIYISILSLLLMIYTIYSSIINTSFRIRTAAK